MKYPKGAAAGLPPPLFFSGIYKKKAKSFCKKEKNMLDFSIGT